MYIHREIKEVVRQSVSLVVQGQQLQCKGRHLLIYLFITSSVHVARGPVSLCGTICGDTYKVSLMHYCAELKW